MTRFKGRLRGERDFFVVVSGLLVFFFWNRVLFLCCKWQKHEVRIIKRWRLCSWQITGQIWLSLFNFAPLRTETLFYFSLWRHYLRGSIHAREACSAFWETETWHWKDAQKKAAESTWLLNRFVFKKLDCVSERWKTVPVECATSP